MITTRLFSSANGVADYDAEGLRKVHRACVGDNIKDGDIFNVDCDGGAKLGAVWRSNLERSLSLFSESHPAYLEMLQEVPHHGNVGRHDWAIGAPCEDCYPVFVDDRQLSYRRTEKAAMAYALEIIARLQADGDYRLNEKPAGFLPPPLPISTAA